RRLVGQHQAHGCQAVERPGGQTGNDERPELAHESPPGRHTPPRRRPTFSWSTAVPTTRPDLSARNEQSTRWYLVIVGADTRSAADGADASSPAATSASTTFPNRLNRRRPTARRPAVRNRTTPAPETSSAAPARSTQATWWPTRSVPEVPV